jgi:hypothetical protein
VLDVSQEALEVARRRLGDEANTVRWIVHDVLTWRPLRRYRLWHDRAAFHSLVSPDQRAAYLAVLHTALAPGGSVFVATFADDGPQMCSGLPTARYAPDELAAAFGSDFEAVTSGARSISLPLASSSPSPGSDIKPTAERLTDIQVAGS